MNHLRAVDGREDAEYKAQREALAVELEGSSGFVCVFDKGPMRRIVVGGEVDPDAVAGYVLRCMAAMANEESGP